jgi:glycosyltransferase involved in cell wall biosynthesis
VFTPEPSVGRKTIQGLKNYTFAKLLVAMKIGILGTRGIPNVYGGFEQFAQYLALGLVRKGYEVYVYNSSEHPYRDKEWNGVHIIHCRDWEKSIGTAGQFIYDYNCFRDAAGRDFDVLLQLGYTSNSIWRRLWPRKAINVINMDGQEWKRSKYNKLTRKFLRLAERWAVKHGDILIADSVGIRDYIRAAYGRDSIYIAYGAAIPATFDPEIPAKYGLRRNDYYLLMARMEPENNIEMIIRGWMASGKAKPLVLIGNPGNAFGSYLVRTYSQEKLHFIGAIYEADTVNALRHYSSVYLHGHSVGGTNPSLLEAMACGCSIAAHDNPFNKAVLNKEALYFSSPADVRAILDEESVSQRLSEYKEKNVDKIKKLYNWATIIDQYEEVFLAGVI